MVFIYILELEDNKYYVGKTHNPNFRLDAHFNSIGSSWTKKYKPIKLLNLIPNCSNFDEDKYTKEYMSKKGIDNVRGGSYCKIKLDSNVFDLLEKEISSASDNCYKCGEKGHFANNCSSINKFIPAIKFDGKKSGYIFKVDSKGSGYYLDNNYKYTSSKPENQEKYIKHELTSKLNKLLIEQDRCFRCHRYGHYAEDCYAKNNIHGELICDSCESEEEEFIEVFCCSYCNREFDTKKGADYHQRFYCRKK